MENTNEITFQLPKNVFKVNVRPYAEKEVREVYELCWGVYNSECRGELCHSVPALFASMTPVSHPENV